MKGTGYGSGMDQYKYEMELLGKDKKKPEYKTEAKVKRQTSKRQPSRRRTPVGY
ncbi:MAG: hypothetical protein V3U34_00720 [candidate division NC10 bacterium]